MNPSSDTAHGPQSLTLHMVPQTLPRVIPEHKVSNKSWGPSGMTQSSFLEPLPIKKNDKNWNIWKIRIYENLLYYFYNCFYDLNYTFISKINSEKQSSNLLPKSIQYGGCEPQQVCKLIKI